MILFFECGRLGNQLFQYAYLNKSFQNHTIYLFGFRALKSLLEEHSDQPGVRLVDLGPFSVLIDRILHLAARLRLIGIVYETQLNGDYKVRRRYGFLWNVYLVMPSFFQHYSITSTLDMKLAIKNGYLQSAYDWLQRNELERQDNLVFIHVRRGDYLYWPSVQNPAALDKSWYIKAAKYIEQRVPNARFLIVTDDPDYCKQELASLLENGIIAGEDMLTDFVLMTYCRHGVMSASTFSWWAAWISRCNNHAGGSLFVAPKYWVGHRVGLWYPNGFKSDWIKYID